MGVSICLKSFFEKKKKSVKMQLFVRGYLGVHTVDVTGFESVESLRNHVCQLEGIDEVENQILNFNGAPLIEEEPLLACGLSELTTIEMTSRLLGGKVHGSPVPAKSRVKRPRWRSKRRRRRRPEGREEESSTTGDSSTSSLLSAERRGPIPTANRLFFTFICAGQSGHCRFRVPFPESFCLCSLLLQLTSSNSLVPRVKSWRI